MMRTNIVIDDELMEQVLQTTGIKTKREAVDRGLRLLLQRAEQVKMIRELRGKIQWDGDLDVMRRD
jgi:Arc/MetJ family transcription regulator